jgi:hypothetical protein
VNLSSAIEHALDGNAILFLGAGFSTGAHNLRDKPLMTSGQLASHLAKIVDIEEDAFLEDAAEEYINRFGKDRLIQELFNEFSVRDVSNAHEIIAQVPWKTLYTTNYDNVSEMSYTRVGRKLLPLTLSDNIKKVARGDFTHCVHINGFIQRLNVETLENEFKLTDLSYITSSLSNSPWMTKFRDDIQSARAVFFVGYSLQSDLDIRRSTIAKRAHDGVTLQTGAFDFDVNQFASLSDLVQVDTAVCDGFLIHGSEHAQQLKRIGARSVGAVVSAVPHFDPVELSFDRTDHVRASGGRMGQYGDSSRVMYAVHQLLHIFESHACGDAVSENVDRTTVQGELEAGNHDERMAGERFAKSDVLIHAIFVENFRMVAHGCETHAGRFEGLNEPLQRFLTIGKHAVDVEHTLQKHLSCDLEHLFNFDRNVAIPQFLLSIHQSPHPDESQIEDGDRRQC